MNSQARVVAGRAGLVLLGLSACFVATGFSEVKTMAQEAVIECCEGDSACSVHAAPADNRTEVGTAAPIACTLTDPEERARRTEVTDELMAQAESVTELPDGFEIEFGSDLTGRVVDYVQYERKCCAFMRFSIAFEPGDGPILLRVTGSPAAKLFMREMFTRQREDTKQATP